MALIEFKNLPDTTTPINAGILNNNFDAMHPTGSILITSTNTNPSSELGGTWELIKKEFKTSYFYSTTASEIEQYITPTSNMTVANLGIVRDGTTVFFRMDFNINTSLSDTSVQMGTINLLELGINNTLFLASYDKVIGSDAGDCVAIVDINASGVMTIQDVIVKGGGTTVASGARFRLEQAFELPQYKILESYCDKFYWKRTDILQ